MIGTIRKHSSVLWWTIVPLTIISFVFFMSSGGMRNAANRNGGLGVIYGQPVTADEYQAANREFQIYYFTRTGEFPERNAKVKPAQIEFGTYERILLARKAAALGVHVSDDAKVAAANEKLAQLGKELTRSGQPLPLKDFLEQILQPEGLTAEDFQNLVAHDVAISQVEQIMAVSGALIPPQEAALLYDQSHQDVSAQAVFFAYSNYLSEVTVTPQAVSMFYSNYMAEYRLPDRVQINYLEFDLTNFSAAAEQKLGKTNLDSQVESVFAQRGLDAVPGAKTAAEAKARIRQAYLRQTAQQLAVEKANDFDRQLFAMDPPKAENLVTLAKQLGLNAHTTAPFSAAEGPVEFVAPAELTATAFKLNTDSPFATKPIASADAVYVVGLASQIPSAVQPLEEIRDRVVEDFRNFHAAAKARAAGTNFYSTAVAQLAAGKSFAQIAVAAGQPPVAIEPFSLSSDSIPEADGHADANQFKQVAFGTQPGHMSQFVPTADGGFVLFIKSLLPVDEALKASELPRFLAQVRHARGAEAFNVWLHLEENREFPNTPVYNEMKAAEKDAASRGQ